MTDSRFCYVWSDAEPNSSHDYLLPELRHIHDSHADQQAKR